VRDVRDPSPSNLRVIKTARSQDAINAAARAGFRPLIKPVVPSSEIRSKFAVLQNRKTGEIKVLCDYRAYGEDPDAEPVIGFTYYYPYHFESPFAAYLIPPDLKIGERVLLEDLIEDLVGIEWNQGDTYRLERCEAIWNGSDFELQYDPDTSRHVVIG
jgi:hypothetical protein